MKRIVAALSIDKLDDYEPYSRYLQATADIAAYACALRSGSNRWR